MKRAISAYYRSKDLQNVKMIRSNAGFIMKQIFPDESVDRIFLLFPEPWVSNQVKKQRKRLMNPEMADICHRLLKENGKLFIKTDSVELAQYHLGVFTRDHEWRNDSGGEEGFTHETPKEIMCTDSGTYQQVFENRGSIIYYQIFQKIPKLKLE
jgi:tRNA G46 methylase TrmB